MLAEIADSASFAAALADFAALLAAVSVLVADLMERYLVAGMLREMHFEVEIHNC